MQVPWKPADEARRIETLHTLDILDTPSEERFDRLTRLARGLFGVPVALVSLVDENRQWFKSRTGLNIPEIPRDISFCGHAILGDNVFLIPDAARDRRFHDNLLVVYEPRIRFYAGCPLTAPNGSKLGTLCLIDRIPRDFRTEDQALLRDLARMAEQELTTARTVTMDELTQLSNRQGFEVLSRHVLEICRQLEKPASLLFFDLRRLRHINGHDGRAEDRALNHFARSLKQVIRDTDVLGRLDGDEFAVLLANAGRRESNAVLHRLLHTVEQHNRMENRGYDIVFSVCVVEFDAAHHYGIADLLADAGTLMYMQKQQRRERKRTGQASDSGGRRG